MKFFYYYLLLVFFSCTTIYLVTAFSSIDINIDLSSSLHNKNIHSSFPSSSYSCHFNIQSSTTKNRCKLQMMNPFDTPPSSLAVPMVVATSLVLFISAQSLINSMLEGEQGLGAYLSDGKGYNGSKFKKMQPRANRGKDGIQNTREDDNDPLPWLKLPRLDYVQVAGQEKEQQQEEEKVIVQLEALVEQMKREKDGGDMDKALQTKRILEELMEKYDIEYTTTNGQ